MSEDNVKLLRAIDRDRLVRRARIRADMLDDLGQTSNADLFRECADALGDPGWPACGARTMSAGKTLTGNV